MMKFFLLFLLALSKLGLAQNFPTHYKLIQKTNQNGALSEQTYYLSIHQTKETSDKQRILELQIEGMEEVNLKDSTVSYSSMKTEDVDKYLNNSVNFLHLMRSYLPIPFTIQVDRIVIDSVRFQDRLAQLSDEFGLNEFFSADNRSYFYNEYKNLLDELYFFDLSGLARKELKESVINKDGFTYEIKAQNKRQWTVQKSTDDSIKIFQLVQFDPKTKLMFSNQHTLEGTTEFEGKPFQYGFSKSLSSQKEGLIEKPSDHYVAMIIKGSYWSRYFRFNQEVDSLKLRQYISDYQEEFRSDINYLKNVLSAYQAMGDYETYYREIIKIPSKRLVNTAHLMNKVRNSELSIEDFLEGVALLSDEQLYDYLQSGLSQGIKSNSEESLVKMKAIFSNLSDREKRAIGPMLIWATYKDSKDNQNLQEGIDQLQKLSDSEWRQGNVGRYLMMLIQIQFANGRTDLNDYAKLQSRLKVLANDGERATKLINKAHLAHVNFLMFDAIKESSPEEAMSYIKQAYDLSAKSRKDYEYQSFYDKVFTGSKQDYTADYLAALGNQYGKDRVLQQYIDEFSNSPAKTYAMLKQFYHENYGQSGFAEFLKEEAFPQLQTAPAFLLKDLQGDDIAPSQFKGKWTFIDFWGTWCQPCVAELPEFNALYEEKLSSMTDKLMVLTISCYDQQSDVTAFMAKHNYKFPVLMSDGQVQRDYKVTGYPSKVLITPDGKLIPIEFGEDWKGLLEEFLLYTSAT